MADLLRVVMVAARPPDYSVLTAVRSRKLDLKLMLRVILSDPKVNPEENSDSPLKFIALSTFGTGHNGWFPAQFDYRQTNPSSHLLLNALEACPGRARL